MISEGYAATLVPVGISLRGSACDASRFMDHLAALDLSARVSVHTDTSSGVISFRADAATAGSLAPDLDTVGLAGKLNPGSDMKPDDLEREILLAMLLSPVRFEYPDFDALASAVRIRKNIVAAASKTELAFDTTWSAERPADCWTFSDECGFTLKPGKPLIEALRKATQPEVSGTIFAFSCYRATEYVILLGIAEELEHSNPALLERLQRQWETRAIKSGAFHEVFLIEYGSMNAPLPPKYYVPGDRLWFRNPDDRSSDIEGFEGSWVFYLGGGLFTNLWKSHRPYTLTSKCLEIYHWRNGVCHDAAGNLKMDESIVEARIQASLRNPEEMRAIIGQMMRLRDPQGIYVAGGCIDTSREYPRSICLRASEFVLPDA